MYENLKNVTRELDEYAEHAVSVAYQKIIEKIEVTPMAARSFEQNELTRFFLDLSAHTQQCYTEAFRLDGVEYPDLLWTEHVNPKLEHPPFKYCSVATSADAGDAGAVSSRPGGAADFKYTPSGGENPDKFLSKAIPPIGATVIGAVAKIAGSSETMKTLAIGSKFAAGAKSFLSFGGSVLIFGGIAALGGVTLYALVAQKDNSGSIGTSAKEQKSFDVPYGQLKQVELKRLMEEQQNYNWKVTQDWLQRVARYAQEAEAAEEKQRSEEHS